MHIGAYEVIEELGRGGMAAVYLVRTPEGEERALKLLHLPPTSKAAKRFAREVRALARLDHPGVVRVLDTGQDERGRPFALLERVEGRSLGERLQTEGPLPVLEAVERALQVAEALAHVHEEGLLHRDLKPANVLETPAGRVKLVDFGLARDASPATSWSQLTADGQHLGTPAYWAPEQAHGDLERQGPWTDVFGLGGVLFALLTGQAPQPGNLAQALLALEDPPRAPSALRPQVDRTLDEVVLRCLARDPQQRYPGAGAAARDLRAWLRAHDAARPPRRSRLWIPAAAAMAASAGLAAAAAWSLQGRAPAPAEAPPPAPEEEEEEEEVADDEPGGETPADLFAAAEASRDPARAAALYRQAAEAGLPRAMTTLGRCLAEGRGLAPDAMAAARWYRRAADAGDARGAYELSQAYGQGAGVPQDQEQAYRWARQAAEAGVVEARLALAERLLEGNGCERSPREGEVWLRLAAEEGIAEAQHKLGLLYHRGPPDLRDIPEALRWYQRAREAGRLESVVRLGFIYQEGEGVRVDLTAAERYFREAAEGGSSQAAYRLGVLLIKSPGREERGIRWLRAAAEAGQVEAVVDLGVAYVKGTGVRRDPDLGVRWFERGAEAGSDRALYFLGFIFDEGDGVEVDAPRAARYYQAAAEQGNTKAMRELAKLYDAGRGVAEDPRLAFRWRLRAAEAGDPYGMMEVAASLSQGLGGVAEDDEEAIRWVRRAARAEHLPALLQMGMVYEQNARSPSDLRAAADFYRRAIAAGDEEQAPARLRALREAHPDVVD